MRLTDGLERRILHHLLRSNPIEMARSKSSKEWLERHLGDAYVKRAQLEGYRSRAAYKLLEIQHKDGLISAGAVVVDLGAAPGGWSQVAREFVGAGGAVFAVDILPLEPIDGVTFIAGDFREQQTLDRLSALLDGRGVDLVISDMAPNLSGMTTVDQPRSIYLCELALDFAVEHLKPGGDFLTKIFQGEGFDDYLRRLRGYFRRVMTRKPHSSRSQSSEVYLIGRDFKV
jgi:23S rRNA (uridine2552-2'-O)-methyltransferase